MVTIPKRTLLRKFPWENMLNYKRLVTPYRSFNKARRCIFVHIPKNGGSSVVLSLFKRKIKHRKIIDFKLYNQNNFENYFKFAFVRNPWDRMVSGFFYLKKGGDNIFDKWWSDGFLFKFDNLENFFNELNSNELFKEKVLAWHHFQPQYKFICIDDKIAVDFLGRFENLGEDFEYVKNKLGINCELIHTNKSRRDRDYRKYYNERTKKIVEDLYKKDIELFKYKF